MILRPNHAQVLPHALVLIFITFLLALLKITLVMGRTLKKKIE